MNVCPLVVCQFPPSGPLAPDVRLCDRNGEADEPREPALWFLPWQSRLQVRQEQAATDRSLTSHHIQHSVELFIQSTLHRWERVHVQHGYLLCELNTHKHESHGGQWTTSSAKSTTWSYSVMLFHSWRTNQINWWHHVLSDVSTDRDSVQDHKQFIKKKVMIFLFTVAVLMEWNPTVSTHLSVTSVGSVFGISFSATLVCNKMFYNPYLVSWLLVVIMPFGQDLSGGSGHLTISVIDLEGFHNLLSISIIITFIYKLHIMTWTRRSKWCGQLDSWCWLDELLTWLLFGCPIINNASRVTVSNMVDEEPVPKTVFNTIMCLITGHFKAEKKDYQ